MGERPKAGAQLAWLSLAMFLGMTLWFSATAANGPIVAEFGLSPTETAWLTMAVQGGFVGGTLLSALLNLPDIINPRRLFAIGCVIAAAANAALVLADGSVGLIVLRVATGAALAWVYPPGMKIAAGWFDKRRGAALGVLIGALTVGSAFPHLLASASATLDWRRLMLSASALAVVGGALVGRHRPRRAVRREQRALRSQGGRTGVRRSTHAARNARLPRPHVGAVRRLDMDRHVRRGESRRRRRRDAQLPGGFRRGVRGDWQRRARIGGRRRLRRSDRQGARRDLGDARQRRCCAAAGFVFHAPPAVLFAFAVVWGIAVVADSAQLSALVAQYSPREHVGTALTIQTCAGFLLTMASIRLLPVAAQAIGWQWVFLCLVPGPFLGAWALRGLDDGVRDSGFGTRDSGFGIRD